MENPDLVLQEKGSSSTHSRLNYVPSGDTLHRDTMSSLLIKFAICHSRSFHCLRTITRFVITYFNSFLYRRMATGFTYQFCVATFDKAVSRCRHTANYCTCSRQCRCFSWHTRRNICSTSSHQWKPLDMP